MNFDVLQEFIVLAQKKNYSDAAEKLNISEPSLSRHIRMLEEELKVKLFDRTSRQVQINKYGLIFLNYAEQLLETRDECINELEDARETDDNSITIGCCYFIDDLLASFFQYDNSIAINPVCVWESSTEVINALREGKCDVAFVNSPIENAKDLNVISYEKDEYVAVLPESHPLAGARSINLSDLAKDDFISFTENSYGDIHLKKICRMAGFEPKIVLTAHIGSAIASFIREGTGVSVLLKKSLQKVNPPGVVMVDLKPQYPFDIYFCYSGKADLTPAIQEFVTYTTKIWPGTRTK